MTVIEVKENGAIRTKMLSCDSPFVCTAGGEVLGTVWGRGNLSALKFCASVLANKR